jgi:hypothetical protein
MNDKIKHLILAYKTTPKADKRKQIIEEIILTEKGLPDFLKLLEEARNSNFDLDFSKAIIDNFFDSLDLETTDLLTFYKKVKGRVFESYFVGNLYRKNINFKNLECFYLKFEKEDKNLAKILFQVMTSTAFSVEHFLSLLCYNELTPIMEQNFLVEIKKQNGYMSFWVKAYEKARPNSALMSYAEHVLRQKMAARPFVSAYDFYMEHSETKVAPALLEVLADMAKTEPEIDKVLYLTPRNSKTFLNLTNKKEKLVA